MRSLRNLMLLTATVALVAGMAVFGSTTRTAEADTPEPVAGEILVHKHCVPDTSVGTFDVTLDFDITPDDGTADDDFDRTFTISCGSGDVEDPNEDGDTVLFSESGAGDDFDLTDLFTYLTDNTEASATGTITEAPVPGVTVTYQSVLGDTTCTFLVEDDEGEEVADVGEVCIITNEIQDPNIFISKTFDGQPEDFAFEFVFNTDAVDGCLISIDGGAIAPILDGESFFLMNGQEAQIACPSDATFTITEVVPEGVTIDGIDCLFDNGAQGTADAETGTVTGDLVDGGIADCDFSNSGEVVEEGLSIIVMKECVGEVEGDFSVDIGDDSEDIDCGETVTFEDLEAGTYTLTETIEGGSEGLETTITCDGGETQEGTSAEVTLVDADVTCVIVNGIDVDDLVCPCPGQEIDIDNTNTNVIGIDNENENDNLNANNNENENENENDNENNNTNTNTQNQENKQDQKNENNQTNNIDASPKVNIDLD